MTTKLYVLLLVCLVLFSSVLGQTRDCVSAGFKQLGKSSNANASPPLYPVDPKCYPQINKDFYQYPAPSGSSWKTFAEVNSCVEFQDTQASTGGWFLQQVLSNDLGNNRMVALQQFFGQLVYKADNQLLYNNLPAQTKNLDGSKNIIPACMQKDNQDAYLAFWYNSETHVLRVRFYVAVPYFYASKITTALSSLDKIKTGLMNIFNPTWLTTALGQTVWPAPQSCFVSAMQQLNTPGASVSCGSAGTMTTTKADEAKEVQAAEEAERKLAGPIKIQAKGAIKVLGGGTNGVRTTLGGR